MPDKNLLHIVKIGGAVIDDSIALDHFLKLFAAIEGPKILVHGGGRKATELAVQMGVSQQMHQGRRVTGADTLDIVTMVYAGSINKNIVAGLQALSCNALGLSGADGNLIPAVKRPLKDGIDFGFVGDVLPELNTGLLQLLLSAQYVPVIAPITHNQSGQLLNTNADTIAQELAKALAAGYEVKLVYTFEKNGVLTNAEDDDSVIPVLLREQFGQMKTDGSIFAGMIPKLDNAFAAIDAGVAEVIIGHAGQLQDIVNGRKGTIIRND